MASGSPTVEGHELGVRNVSGMSQGGIRNTSDPNMGRSGIKPHTLRLTRFHFQLTVSLLVSVPAPFIFAELTE